MKKDDGLGRKLMKGPSLGSIACGLYIVRSTAIGRRRKTRKA